MLTERYKTKQSYVNKLSNIIVRDFIDEIAQKYPASSKYASLLRFFCGLKRRKENSLLYYNNFDVNREDIQYQFRYKKTYIWDFPGAYYSEGENLIIIYFPSVIFEEFKKDTDLSIINYLIDKIKESLVHETTHHFQDQEKKKLSSLVDVTTFTDPVAVRLANLVYITHDTELEAIANEAYKMYCVHKHKYQLSYYQCFLIKITPYILGTFNYTNKIIDRKFDLGDIIRLLTKKKKNGVDDLFALYYIFYGFLPQTKYGELIKTDKAYSYYSRGTSEMQLLIDNRDEITELIEMVIKARKIKEFEKVIKKSVQNGDLIKLCAWYDSNAEVVDKIAMEVFS